MRRIGLGAAGVALGLHASHAAPSRERPNILFVLTDDQRHDFMSNVENRFPYLQTPHMDRLAREGVRFENAFVTTPLCSPSRASFLTGRYAHSHGVRNNQQGDFDAGIPAWPSLLRDAGHRTAFIGKWHMARSAAPRSGFDHWVGFSGQGQYLNCSLNENGHAIQPKGYITDVLTDHAVAWLGQQTGPFCLILSHKAAHAPFTPAPRHAEAFSDATLPEPPSWGNDLSDKPAWYRRNQRYGPFRRDWEAATGRPTPRRIPPVRWQPRRKQPLNQLCTLLAVDESLGRILAALEKAKRLDNTVVIFAGDNGYSFGEQRSFGKRFGYEPNIRIPLIVRYPKRARAGMRPTQMALNLDLAPTLLDLAGVDAPAAMQGHSLVPLLDGRTPEWRHSWLYEYFGEGATPGLPTMLGIRTDRWKYITVPQYPDDVDELYDLANDPHELMNLARHPAHGDTLRDLREEFERLKEQTAFTA